MTVVLAIDQSTSGTKALLFDDHGNLLDQISLEHRQFYPKPGWVEHDAEEIYQNLISAAGSLLQKNPAVVKDLLCLSITNQRETVVVFEKGTGKPLRRAIVWQCRRGADLCDRLAEEGHSDLVHQHTGLKIDTYFSASKLRWLVEEDPEIGRGLREGQALVGTVDSYLIYRLTGGQVHATDVTNASRTLLYDINQLGWDEELCRLFKVPVHALPEVRESMDGFGQTTIEGLLPSPIPIRGVMGDSQASLFAQCCYAPGTAKVTFGTGSSLLLNIGSEVKLSQQGIVTAIAWVYRDQPTYAFEGLINFSAATISWLKNQLRLIQNAAETEELALSVAGNDGVYLVPAFVGLSAPYWQPDARAAIVGMTSATTRAHVVRAALESIACQVKDVLELMAAESGVPLQRIEGDGGAVRNRFLMQFVADMVRYPLRIPDLAELSALGAVFAGYLGSGLFDSLDDLARLPRHTIQYIPQMPVEQVAQLYAGWKSAVQRVL